MIKRAVEEVVKAEDRSKNLMVFGLKETDKEVTGGKIDEPFVQLGTKPRHESVRICVKKDVADNSCSIKVSLTKRQGLGLSQGAETGDHKRRRQNHHHLLFNQTVASVIILMGLKPARC